MECENYKYCSRNDQNGSKDVELLPRSPFCVSHVVGFWPGEEEADDREDSKRSANKVLVNTMGEG